MASRRLGDTNYSGIARCHGGHQFTDHEIVARTTRAWLSPVCAHFIEVTAHTMERPSLHGERALLHLTKKEKEMPNWCVNRVTFSGPARDVEAIRSLIGTDKQIISFQKIKPMPSEYEESSVSPPTDGCGAAEWFFWRLANWGTKQDVFADHIRVLVDVPDCLSLQFDTAWEPAHGIYRELRKLVNEHELSIDITWIYEEPDMGLAGEL